MRTTDALGPNAHLIGIAGGLANLTTPALVLDPAAMQRNLGRHQELASRHGLRTRPHVKSHKCSEIARRQIAAGAVGVSAVSLREAEVMAGAGIENILITSPVIGSGRLDRLSRLLSGGASLSVVVDDSENLSSIVAAARAARATIGVLVDVDLGMGRTGVAGVPAVVALAKRVSHEDAVEYRGLQAYSGIVQHIETFKERDRIYTEQLQQLQEIVQSLRDLGLAPAVVSGGGTGTLAIDCRERILTEHQAGSYALMDVEYHAVEAGPAEYSGNFETSLFLYSRVVSRNVQGRATIDAGLKSFAADGPRPLVHAGAPGGTVYDFFGDEHGKLTLPVGSAALTLGDVVELVTPHCDPTMNLHDFIHVVEGDTLVDIWRIDARGVL